MACPVALGQVGSVVSMDVAVVLCSLRLTRNLFRYHVDNGGNGHMEKIEQEDTSETHFFFLPKLPVYKTPEWCRKAGNKLPPILEFALTSSVSVRLGVCGSAKAALLN